MKTPIDVLDTQARKKKNSGGSWWGEKEVFSSSVIETERFKTHLNFPEWATMLIQLQMQRGKKWTQVKTKPCRLNWMQRSCSRRRHIDGRTDEGQTWGMNESLGALMRHFTDGCELCLTPKPNFKSSRQQLTLRVRSDLCYSLSWTPHVHFKRQQRFPHF